MKEQEKKPEETRTPQTPSSEETTNTKDAASISETWAQETIADLDEFIESQGIYIRQ